MSKVKFIDEVDIVEKRVLLRVDFNASLTFDGEIADDTRIAQSLPTIDYLLKHGNKIILVSHLGRPKGREQKFSLKVVADRLQELIPNHKIVLVDDFESVDGKKILLDQQENQVLMLENIRFYEGEKENDDSFANRLASLADVYVNDAFGVAHRVDASVAGVPKYLPSYGGLLLKKETETISKAMNEAKKPFVVILGGAKVSTKLGLLEKLITIADYLLLAGGIANTFLLAEGRSIGMSLAEQDEVENARHILKIAQSNGFKIVLPADVVVGDPEGELLEGKIVSVDNIPGNSKALDIGPVTIKVFAKMINDAATIIWNGPVGYTEDKKYRAGNEAVFKAIIGNEKALSIVGGGDTLASISKEDDLSKITHISTGGGAMLEFIEKGTLPGIEALKQSGSS